MDILGLPAAASVSERTATRLRGALHWPDHTIQLDFQSGPGLPRHTGVSLECARGRCEQRNRAIFCNDEAVTLPPAPPLFATDQRVATATILDGAPHYLSRARILDVLSLRDRLRVTPIGERTVFDW